MLCEPVFVLRRKDHACDAELFVQGDESAAQGIGQAAAQLQRVARHRQVDVVGPPT